MNQIDGREVLSLDGASFTNFWLKAKVMNSPSDEPERAIANAHVIAPKAE